MFLVLLPVLFSLLPQHIEPHSAGHMEQKKRQHKELETEIRRLFQKQEKLIPSSFRLRDEELLCMCNHFASCGKDDVADYVGKQYMNVCRPGRGGYCSRVVFLNSDGTIREVVTSCLSREQLLPREMPFVCQNSKTEQWNKVVNCCKNASFCNDFEFPFELLGFDGNGLLSWFDGWSLPLLFSLITLLLFCTIGICVGIFWRFPRTKKTFVRCFDWLVQCYRRIWDKSTKSDGLEDMDNESEYSAQMGKFVDEGTFSTGSGAGVPMLATRTISRQIAIKTRIGKGRFGDVKLGEWRGEKVAVKIFGSLEAASFGRETEIYRKSTFRHPNILRWIASDSKDTGKTTELWLVTEYHPHGSLLDYLEKHTLSVQQALQFIRSTAHGLAYLHTELPAPSRKFRKPAIAHRDLKPGNILIKNDWTCCIADLGMCICFETGKEVDKPEGGDRGGTARYLAPEFLANSYNSDSFTAYLMMDIYALALVIWEVCRRVEVEGLVPAFKYQVPYYEFVQREPNPAQMKQFVCVHGLRPTIPEEWSKSTVLTELTRVIKESWSAIPQSRLTSLNIRCTLDRICSEENILIIT